MQGVGGVFVQRPIDDLRNAGGATARLLRDRQVLRGVTSDSPASSRADFPSASTRRERRPGRRSTSGRPPVPSPSRHDRSTAAHKVSPERSTGRRCDLSVGDSEGRAHHRSGDRASGSGVAGSWTGSLTGAGLARRALCGAASGPLGSRTAIDAHAHAASGAADEQRTVSRVSGHDRPLRRTAYIAALRVTPRRAFAAPTSDRRTSTRRPDRAGANRLALARAPTAIAVGNRVPSQTGGRAPCPGATTDLTTGHDAGDGARDRGPSPLARLLGQAGPRPANPPPYRPSGSVGAGGRARCARAALGWDRARPPCPPTRRAGERRVMGRPAWSGRARAQGRRLRSRRRVRPNGRGGFGE